MNAPPGREPDSGVLDVLSEPPDGTWPDGVVHHGSRILLLVVVAAFVTVLFPPEPTVDVARYELGMVAEENVLAEFAFTIPKSEEELAQDQAEAVASVPPTFDARPAAADSMRTHLDRFFNRLDSAATLESGSREAIQEVLSRQGIQGSPSQVDVLSSEESRRLLRRTARWATTNLLPRGVLDAAQSPRPPTDRIAVRRAEGERYVDRDSVLTAGAFYEEAVRRLPATAPPDLAELFRLVLIRFLEPTYVLNEEATEEDWEAARRSVPTTKGLVQEGEAVVSAHQQIGSSELDRLNAYQEELARRGVVEEEGPDYASLGGATLLNLLILGIFGLLVFFFRPEVYTRFRWIFLLALLVTAYAAGAALIARSGWPSELIPIAFVSLAVAILWDGRIALVLSMVLAVLVGAQIAFFDFPVLATTLAGGTSAALAVRVVRRRAQTWIFIAIITAAYASVLVAIALILNREWTAVGGSLVWGGVSATASAMLAMGFLPVFEWFTGITTDQTLLEWADPNRPLLKRLSVEAPGTYAHTINVANLAEAASNAVGANGLLARVGVYYHDVGKIVRPQYFVENQPSGRNPHDKLKAGTSASIVREHVEEGVRLAEEAGIPSVIARFIPEHHGTQRIGFFHEKARDEEEAGEEPDPEGFRYPGPKPRTKETAIAMLADSVESATKALQDPTPERVRTLVDRIVDDKIGQGQLDEAPLTLEEVSTIKEQFVSVLTGMYHHRLDYPQTQDLNETPTPAATPS